MGKNFLGLDGLKHFWSKAKSWIAEQITAEVTEKIAEIVANAPEDLDTLKEIADWIKNHANDASAMNTAILANTEAISGKADKSHTHTKSQITDFPTSLKNPNALTVNGKTYDGSSAVNAGVQTIANGGTGQTTANAAANSFINSLTVGTDTPVDADYYVCQSAGGGTTTTTYHRRPVSKLWEYIKGKISSVLGLTADSNENVWSRKQTFNAGINVAGDIQLNSKTLYPSGYVPRTYFIKRATKDTITAEQKELLRKMFAYQSVSRLIQCYGVLTYRFESAGKFFGGYVVTVGYFDGDDWLDSNENIRYDDNSTVNYACFGVQEEAEDIKTVDMYNLSEQVMRNKFEKLNYLLVSNLYFTVLEKI